jgi:CelD/BcsL family acetyltransferase involved in cellulose biosynthesis
MSAPWRIDWLTSWSEVLSDSFWAQWDAWYRSASSRHVFFSPVLAKVWLDTYLPIRNLRPLYLIAQSRETTVFLPLVLWRRNWKNAWQRAIVPVGDSDYDYQDPLVIGDPRSIDWTKFWCSVSSLLDGRADVIHVDGLHQHCAASGDECIQASGAAPFADLSGFQCGEDYLATIKKSVRGVLLKRLKHLEERGPVSYRVFGPSDKDTALAANAVAMEHHRKRWPLAYRAPGFHERLVAAALPASVLLFSYLEFAGVQIAWQLSFRDGPILRQYMPAHDPAWRAYGVSNILRYRDIGYAIRCGLTACDFLRGTEAYKQDWSSSLSPLYRFCARSERIASRGRNWVVESLRPKLRI